tara:strand:+ start:1854 stop:2327 length:474 start_codon:yes stop_codon:yes gene_type:complete
MIEQIYTYFTIETTYLWINLGVMPFWVILIFFPQSNFCKIFTTSIFPLFVFSVIYLCLFYKIFKNDYNFLNNFNLYFSLNELKNLLYENNFLILFWIHFLAINLFCGGWIVKDSQKFAINKILIFFPLLITYLIGPIGLFIYWLIRIFYAKKISLYE